LLHATSTLCIHREGGGVGFAAADSNGVVAPGLELLPGIFNFWPTLMLSLRKLLAARIALTVVPYCLAMVLSVSPDFTAYICSLVPVFPEAGPAEAAAAETAGGR